MKLKITKEMAKTGWVRIDPKDSWDKASTSAIQLMNKYGVKSQILKVAINKAHEVGFILICDENKGEGPFLLDINSHGSHTGMVCMAEDFNKNKKVA